MKKYFTWLRSAISFVSGFGICILMANIISVFLPTKTKVLTRAAAVVGGMVLTNVVIAAADDYINEVFDEVDELLDVD